MKRIVALTLGAGTMLLAGCASIQHATKADSQKAAIASVLAQRAKIKADDERGGLLSEQHVAELKAIDVQSCPADFRSAWFDYVVEVENLHTRVERVGLVASGLGKPAGDLPALIKFAATNEMLGQYLLGALTRVDEAWAKLDRTAMNYGVMAER